MALTLAQKHSFVKGDRRENTYDVTFDASYPTGGLALTAQNLGFSELHSIIPTASTDGHTFGYDYTGSKLLAFSGGSEVANATDLHTLVTRVVATGKGFASS